MTENEKIANFLALSVENDDFETAKYEWVFEGDIDSYQHADLYDTSHQSSGECEHCGRRGLREAYNIRNKHNKNSMNIGKYCLLTLNIKGVEKIKKAENENIKKAFLDRLSYLSVDLEGKDLAIVQSSIERYVNEERLSPRQMVVCLKKLNEYEIEFASILPKLKISRESKQTKEQLKSMSYYDRKLIYPALTKGLKAFVDELNR